MLKGRLQANTAVDTLPVVSPELRAPMQAVYLRTGIGQPTCEAAPDDALLVQGPQDIEIDLTINGANFRLGSTMAVRLLADDLMEIFVIDGTVQPLDENSEPTGMVIRAGQRTTACLGEPDNRGLDGESNDREVACDFTAPEWVDIDLLGSEWCVLQNVPISLLNYPIDLTCPGELLPTPVPSPTNTPLPPGRDTFPVVSPTPDSLSLLPDVDCSNFQMVGPFEGITPRPTVFEWTAAPGATEYEIVFYDFTGGFAASFFTPNTQIELNVGQIPTGSELKWEVRAYRDRAYACVTSRTGLITRLADPFPPASSSSSGGFSASMACGPGGPGRKATVTWSGAGSGDTIRLTYTEGASTFTLTAGTGSSGSASFGRSGVISSAKLDTSSGDSVTLGRIDCSSFC